MLSPAAHHRATANTGRAFVPAPVETATSAASANPLSVQHRAEQHRTVAMEQFINDKNQLERVRSHADRKTRKQHALSHYQSWLDSTMQRQTLDVPEQSMFVWLTLWHIDTGEWARGLELARFALAGGMYSPKGFIRTLLETVSEEIAGGILKAGNPADYLDLLDDLAQWVEGHDMTDQISAKLHKAHGLARLNLDPARARESLLKALALDSKSGVKRYLTALDLDGKPTRKRTVAESMDSYTLSATAAAKVAKMTPPAFIRHAKKHPDLLPRVEIPLGKRTLYRFNPKHVKAYLKQHLIKSK